METGVCKMSESRTIKKKQGINGKTNKNNLNNGFKNLFLRRLFKRQKYVFFAWVEYKFSLRFARNF